MALSMKFAWSFSSKNLLLQSYIFTHGCQRSFGTKKVDSEVAEKPKKPMTLFLAYYSSVRKDLAVKYPGKNVAEITPMVAKMYKNISDTEKKKLEENYAKQKEQYKVEMERWMNNLTDEQKAEMQAMKEKKKTEKVEKQAIKDISKPKRPVSGFFMFYQSKRQSLPYEKRSAEQLTMVSKELGKLWESMPEQEKRKYDNTAAIEQYKKDLLEWEKEMVSKGVHSLVRKDVLKQLVPPKPRQPRKKRIKEKTSRKERAAKKAEKEVSAKTAKSEDKSTPKK